MIVRGHKIRIYPTVEQARKLLQTVGGVRFAYNWTLENWKRWTEERKQGIRKDNPNWIKLSKLWTLERPEWAVELPRDAVTEAFRQVNVAFTRHFKEGAGWPKFKKRGVSRDSFYVNAHKGAIRPDGKHIHIPGIKRDIKMAEPLRFAGKVMAYTVSCYAGKWYVSVRMEIEDLRSAPDSVVGVDVGMKTPAVCSDGTTLTLPFERLRKLERRLKRAQRIVSRRQKLSSRRAKALRRKQRVQDRINNIRCDAIHKFTSTVCKNHATVVVEDLNMVGMHRGPKNVRSGMQRSCMNEVLRQLGYKAVSLVQADRWYPSTQLCSNCGHRQKMKLTQRTYVCPECGMSLDRDLNAAINLSKYPGSLG